jgi:transposase
MRHIAGYDRSQTLLLPESLDEYVGPENPVRFIEAFVDGLDLTAAGFARVTPKVTGRPGYAPADLLKLYIYGYLNRVRSSRRLEAETHRNIEVIWLLRHLKPDFKTIADFRRDNASAFRPVFRQFVLLCRQLDLFGRELIAVDGTRIKAVNNKDRNFTRASLTEFIKLADAKLDDYLQRLDQSDATESQTGGSRVKNLAEKIAAIRQRRTRCEQMLAHLDRTGEAVPWLLSQAAKFAGWGSASAASRDRLHRFAVAEGSRSSDMIGLACHTSPKYPAQEGRHHLIGATGS